MKIEKVAVIGAGVMGAGIAAQVANAGVPVYLLDIVPDGAKQRNCMAQAAIEKLLKAKPPALMQKKNARLLIPGNIEDDLAQLKDVDWVIEAVVEDLKIKKALYQQLLKVCREETLISSNTSTLPLGVLMHGMPDVFRQRFLITHFFNPPRYMRLLELVSNPQTEPRLLQDIRDFADRKLGKGCVLCKDTPGFIANRIGIYWLQCAMLAAMDMQLRVEQADAAISLTMEVPKTGVFALLDLIGLDLIPHILEGMRLALPAEDAFHQVNKLPELLQKLIAEGYTGRKGKGGFYRLNIAAGERIKEAVNLETGDYSPSQKADVSGLIAVKREGIRSVFSSADELARYSAQVMQNTLTYAASLVPEIADDIVAVDTAMRLGYNWKKGPFELLDQIGVDWFVDKLKSENRNIPALLAAGQPLYESQSGKPCYLAVSGGYQPVPRASGIELLRDIKCGHSPLLSNHSASLWDIGEGVVCLEFHSKMNTLDMQSMELIQLTIEKVKQEFSALVIHNEGDNFSAGANLGLLMEAIQHSNWPAVENLIRQGQKTYQALKYSPFPVVAAPTGMALGGGCELLLHCDAIQAHAELYTGLVETGVGLIPAWGGCKEYLRRQLQNPRRLGGPVPPVKQAFETISMAKVSSSAVDARQLLFLSDADAITMNKERLLADAKHKALELARNYSPPEPYTYVLPGKTVKVLFNIAIKAFRLLNKATKYDAVVAQQLAEVLSGGDCDITGPLTEADILNLECQGFLELVKKSGTHARLEHILKTGKPLRN